MPSVFNVLIFLCVILLISLIYRTKTIEHFTTADFKNEKEYKNQVKLLSDKYNPVATAKRPVSDILDTVPEVQQCFVNFYSLGCRYTGYIGPIHEGYWDPDIAIQLAVNAGCRTFVLEIDYLDVCSNYFPRIVVRDAQSRLRIKPSSNIPMCNSIEHSNIKDVCDKINLYAFSSACQNSSDPVVIVLYFLRQPPGSYKSKAVLDYFSNVAKGLSPFKNRLLTNELNGGTFYRQKQEGKLLINKITDYNDKVLIFSNANTLGFREVDTYSPNEDLDFLVNLRLQYTQTKLGITESGTGFGILETADNYTIIPSDRADDIIEQTKLHWTICLSKDPSIPVSKDVYNKITTTYGVHCVPIMLFDAGNDFMFSDKLFKTHSYIPKPEPLRYIKPPIVIPAEPNPSMDAKKGILRAPTI
jgi:hypothetical protein